MQLYAVYYVSLSAPYFHLYTATHKMLIMMHAGSQQRLSACVSRKPRLAVGEAAGAEADSSAGQA